MKVISSFIFTLCFVYDVLLSQGLSTDMNRRTVIQSSILSSSMILPRQVTAAVQGIQGSGGIITRVEGIGGGFDITTSTTTRGKDVIYPKSMEGIWTCRRVVTSIDGDKGQAELAWRNLGGMGTIGEVESFQTRYILPPGELNVQNDYEFQGEVFSGVVLFRGYELTSRTRSEVTWNIATPDKIVYDKDDSPVEIVVVQRQIELPSERGFGFNELYRITSSAGGIFGDNPVQRAVRVQRRYIRAMDEFGNRIVEGLEIQKTYRVLDGIAGVEMPTSTTKSSIQLRRS